jgi:hypothetical protein
MINGVSLRSLTWHKAQGAQGARIKGKGYRLKAGNWRLEGKELKENDEYRMSNTEYPRVQGVEESRVKKKQ